MESKQVDNKTTLLIEYAPVREDTTDGASVKVEPEAAKKLLTNWIEFVNEVA